MDELAICAIFRNEAPYIREWLSYHYALGVRRFVLYDNASTDETRAIIEAWPRRELVTLIDWPDQESRQLRAYADMVVRCRGAVEWAAFIDCDEFLTPQSDLSLSDILGTIGRAANGLYVHWWMFGSSGHDTRQPGLVTETFRWRAPDAFGSHHYGKSVMRISAVTHVGIHVFRCHGLMVNDSGTAIDQQSAGFQERRSHKLLALNHYFTKSREEWRARRGRGRADKEPADADYLRPDSEFAQHDINAVQDDRAKLFMQAARALFYLPPAQAPAPLTQTGHIVTVHGTLLCWDRAASRALHCTADRLTDSIAPIRFAADDAEPLRYRLYRESVDSPAPIDGHAIFSVEPAGPGAAVHLRTADSYLCAEGASPEVHANRGNAREWETFIAVPEEAVARLRAARPEGARLLPGFQLALGEDHYDLQWSVPLSRLAAVAAAVAEAAAPAMRSLAFYDLSGEEDAVPATPAPRLSTTDAPAIGPGLPQLLEAGRISIVNRFPARARYSRATPFLAIPVGNPKAPYAALFSDPAYRAYTPPEMDCFALQDACILGGDALLWFAGGLVRDSVHSLEPWRTETLAAEPPAAEATQLRLKREVVLPHIRQGRFFCGFVGAWRNYAHWLTECLPRLVMFRALQAHDPGLRLVLPRVETGGVQDQTLALLGIGAEHIVWLGDGEALAGEIWTTTSIDPWAVPDICREAAGALASGCRPGEGQGERLYIRRGTDTRRMMSLPLLLPTLQEHGFSIVTMQDLTLADQIRTMQAAHVVIGENGAALANIMFCRPGARVLELFNEAWANPAHWTLASLCGLGYGYIEGRHVPSAMAPMPSHNADYVITPEQLDAGLRVLLAS